MQDKQLNEAERWIGEYKVLDRLGEGTYSNVFKVIKKNSEVILALKQIEICNFEPKEQHNILNEVRILSSINHPNIISYKESFVDFESKTLCIVTEYADYGDLFDCIYRFKELQKPIAERDIWIIVFQILRGLNMLHANQIIHRDLKSANIFLFSDGSVKIGDMNVATVVKNKNQLATTQTGTPYYSSPEIWEEVPYSYKSDMWSIGCLVYEMTAQRVPFDAENVYQLMKKITDGSYETLPKQYSIEITTLVQLLLSIDPEKRPTCKEILVMDFIKKIERYLEDNYGLKNPEDFQKHTKTMLYKTIRFDSLEILHEQLKAVKQTQQKCNEDSTKFAELEKEKQNIAEKIQRRLEKNNYQNKNQNS